MNQGGEVADQVLSMSLRSLEVIAKLSGAGAKNLAVYLCAILSSKKKTRGRARLETMLRSGKTLKVFAVKNEDLKMFTKEAKKYGVLYCALKDKKSIDGMCDIMVRAEDASKINRIVERFDLSTVDTATIKSEIQKSKAEKAEKEMTPQNTDIIMEDLLTGVDATVPQSELTEIIPPSESISKNTKGLLDSIDKKKSVRAELFEIKQSSNALKVETEKIKDKKDKANISKKTSDVKTTSKSKSKRNQKKRKAR